MRIDIHRLTTAASFLGFVVTHAHAEPLSPAARLAIGGSAVIDGSAADGAFRRRRVGELPAQVIAQDVGQVDLLNHDLEASQTTAPTASSDPTCHTLATAADANNLPLEFLTRLIWQESRFDPQAVSPAGAQGVAQFMPKTAAWQGLADPFDPVQAITKSAELLRDLRTQFGNLGLAAAAYNAGPARVQDWLARRRSLPKETRDYVRIVTGRSAEEWTTANSSTLNVILPDGVPCPEIAKLIAKRHSPTLATRTLATPSKSEARLGRAARWRRFGDQCARRLSSAPEEVHRILGPYQPLIIQNHGKTASWYRVVSAQTPARAPKNYALAFVRQVGAA